MSATQLEERTALARPRRRLRGAILPTVLAMMVAAGIALATLPSAAGGGAETSGTSIDRPAHAPGPNGEQRPT
jgi:hypothetical protein